MLTMKGVGSMKVTKATRTRCECDYCGKKNWSIGAMKKHELHCTKNPDRECRVCQMVEGTQKPIAELMALLPDPATYETDGDVIQSDHNVSDSGRLTNDSNAALKELRELCDSCPGCIMAAFRQKGIPVPLVTDFDFSKEMKSLWNDINEERRGSECGYY